ncbi:hypothetical protein GTP38_11720 [Duganella sp. FT94W]|uniref:N-acetyltransferase domain-containing protein n=1 Tax=Duganella lactea TaxID=2692173 RepID=A0ABW9V8K3_9BURK|nr:GNAT family N-acetyltransferase [Duganella lactea]MYM35003.1 hypothetical protein [Duganella lactea]
MSTRLRITLAQLGWLNAALYLLARVLRRVSGGRWALHRYLFVAQYISDQPLTPLRGADINIMSPGAGEALPEDYPRPARVVQGRYTQGARTLTAWRQGRLAGFIWLIQNGYQEDEVRAHYRLASPRAGWDFDVWVRPEERLGWVFRRLWEAARQHLRQRGIHWSCSRISAFNAASLRAHAQIGMVRLGHALFLRCGSWQWMLGSVRPYLHVSRSDACYPRLIFDTSTLQEPPCPNFRK